MPEARGAGAEDSGGFIAEVMTHKWLRLTHKHDGIETPRYLISHVCICVADAEISPEMGGGWFSEAPQNMIPEHAEFLREALCSLTVGRGPIQI